MSKPVITFVFKVLRNGQLRRIFSACPNLWLRPCSKCYGMDSFGAYCTCPKLWLRSYWKCYAMDCFGAYFQHVQTCDYVRVQNATECTASVHTSHVQTCGYVRVRSATAWTASVHTSHMSKPVITLVFKVLRNRLLWYILHSCPGLWLRSCSKCYSMNCFGTCFTHAQTCDNVRVQSVTQWRASVHSSRMPKPVIMFVFKVLPTGQLRYILHMPKPVIMFVFKVLPTGQLRYILHTCPSLW